MDRIVQTAPIFDAWCDEKWVNDGAAVRVSLISFGHGVEHCRLDGHAVNSIQADLTVSSTHGNLVQAKLLPENRGVCFMGTSKVGPFEIEGGLAREWLLDANSNGAKNSEVLRPWVNGQSLTGRPTDTWIIDFGTGMSRSHAALYQAPFEYVAKYVKPARATQRRDAYRNRWWIHAEARPGLRAAMGRIRRLIATPRVSKHRFFVWLPTKVLPDSRLFAICKDDDFTFGVLSSRFHKVWALAMGSRHGDGVDGGRPTYNAERCFETFPFPAASVDEREKLERVSRRLSDLRTEWLNPRDWTQRIAEVVRGYPDRIVPKPGCEELLKKRTMTALYNEYPSWLADVHDELDRTVAAVYGWADYSAEMPDEAIIARLLKLNGSGAPDLFSSSEKHLAVVKSSARRPPAKVGVRARYKSAA